MIPHSKTWVNALRQSLGRSLLVLLLAGAAQAQYRFDTWTTDNGLPQVSINSITQTRDGFLWLTTYGGLVRYDGLRFQVFNPGNTSGLRTGRLIGLFEDRDGNLWISTEGQGITKYRDGVFTNYTTENGLPGNQVNRMEGDAEGNLLLEIGDSRLRWTGEAFSRYSAAAGEPDKGILQRAPGGAIWYWDGTHLRKFEHGRVTVEFAPRAQVLRAFEDSQGRVWIAADGTNDLIMFKNGKPTSYRASASQFIYRFIRAFEDRQRRLWFATPSGLLLFRDGKFTSYTTADGLVRGGVTSIYQDREGTLWVGTTGGLSRVTERAITSYSTQDGLAGENVYPIYEDREGRIWLGSWTGLTLYQDGRFQDVSSRYSLTQELTSALLEDREGNLWIGTWGKVFIRTPDDKITLFPQHERIGPRVRAIYQDRAGNIWFGSANGLSKALKSPNANGSDFQLTSYTAKDGLLGKEVFVIQEDRQGQLWIGTEAGLNRYQNGVVTGLTEKDGIARGIVRAIYEDRDGALWVGMYDTGLYRFKNGQFTHYRASDGLFDDGAFQIIEDDRGYFWISCNLGIYRVRRSELDDFAAGRIEKVTSVPYNKRDGMLNSECNGGMHPAGIRARDGRIWFPTQQGVAVINPAAVPLNSQPPPVVIESLIVDTKSVGVPSQLQLKPGQEYLEIHYSGLSFINPELVRFKYKLEGLDHEWIDAGTRRTAYYSHLPPGQYSFKVIAANRDGIWNEQGAMIQLEVLPPFWRTWWFISLAIISIALASYLVYRQRIRELKRAHAMQEAFSRQLIQSQESERRRIAAELHDSLGQSLVLIRNWALLGLKAIGPQEPAADNLNEISTTASAAIDEVREIAYNLGPYQLERFGLVRTLREMIEKVAGTTPIRFRVAIDDLDGAFSKETEISVYRIVQEAINNIVKHSQASEATIEVTRDLTRVVIKITDSGKGFVTEARPAAASRGFGLIGIEERVRMLNGNLAIHSAPGQGTRLEIALPVLEKEPA
ncbi:MAG TPA: two-component regulator propeller domain-containing protein [Pyrinomonadaceae bacterium]